jgi:membrane protease YdiL (CAAX protease family)
VTSEPPSTYPPVEPGRELAPRGRLALGLWLLVAGLQVAAAFAGRAADSGADADQPLYDYSLAIGSLVIYAILVGATFWIASLFPNRRAALGLQRFPARSLWLVLGVVVAGLVVSAALEPILHAGEEQGLEPERWEPSKAAPFAINALVIVTVVPFAEELFFRGLGVRVFQYLGSTIAILATAVVFGLAHGIPEALPALGFFGLCLAWLRVRTDSVWPSVIAHSLYNGLGIAGFLLTS